MELFLKILGVAASAYLLGSIPSSFIMAKMLKGIDLREHGSGNLGAANTFRILGASAAVPVLIIDIGKGFLAVKLVSLAGIENFAFIALAALMAIIGHNYSVFVKFSGGKGVGTTTGAFLAIVPVAVVICIAIWLIILLVTRIVSVASIAASIALPLAVIASRYYLGRDTDILAVVLSVIVTVVVVYKHRSNIRRLRNHEEKRIF
ncbi:MAG: glycerol-3-phosphate 1-O-acyltransferase PlsY [Candidatus Latescibacteria bacterium]|nr:glycerol-3-phosphate 1-O-acyltransferase PlsY [bacterium]MBD3423659.1 glycerol-3-phosphate 1-O-acyltransferase PlsY [Candidatus Latescibacterota bacterium]